MRLRLDELNEAIRLRGLTVDSTVCGDMVLAHLRRRVAYPIPHLAKGLPDEVCRAEHWGYVLSGSVIFEMLDGSTERVRAGEPFYCPPGHVYTYDEDAELIESARWRRWFPTPRTCSECSPNSTTRPTSSRALGKFS